MLLSKDRVFSASTFATPLLEWHSHHGRTLPWMTKDPYDVWLSEVMLQQTQVSTVLERYVSFQKRFPTIRSLAAATAEDVLAQWSGLGYYSRARNLHACSKGLVAWLDTHGHWPKEANDWVALPGIGQSTANAIVSACFNKVVPILDANAKRVLVRFAGDLDANIKQAWAYAREAMDVDSNKAAAYTQAMMDLGATVCRARKANCASCPLMHHCKSAGWELKKATVADKSVAKSSKPVVLFDWAFCIRGTGTQAELLLQQRDESSFWPALWVLPAMDKRFVLVEGAPAVVLKHELSHRSLRIEAKPSTLKENTNSNERWVLLADIVGRKIPVPSPIAGLIKEA